MSSKKPTLLFDLDGTLMDPYQAFKESILFAFQKNGAPVPDDELVRACIGPPLLESLTSILGVPKELAPQYLSDYRAHHQENLLAGYSPYPLSLESVTALAATFNLYVATSKPQIYARQIIENKDFAPHFQKVYGSELSGECSVKGDLIRHILKTEGMDPAQCLMIGDRKHDILGAKKNGIKSIGVLWGYGSLDELKIAQADYLVDSFQELVANLFKLINTPLYS